MVEIKTAEQMLRDSDYVNNHGEIDHQLANLMRDYAAQFIDLAAQEAQTKSYWMGGITPDTVIVNKESILKIKKLIR